MNDIEEKVKDVIEETLGVSRPSIVPEADFLNALGADSLDCVYVTMALEEIFDIEVPDEVVEKTKTVGDVYKYLEANVKKGKKK